MKISSAAAPAFALIALILVNFTAADLEVGFYNGKCKSVDVENTVFSVVNRKFKADQTIAPALIRMQFHDCFVLGCDASILLNTTSNSERNADPNKSVRGYDVIDEAKAELEKACEGVVSCADIIAIAARDAVSMTGGGKYPVKTGRRDSLEPAANVDLPSPRFTAAQSIDAFSKRGLNPEETVLLLGAHSIGITHCSHFQDRLNNPADTTMDESLRKDLISKCSSQDATVNLDQNLPSSATMDNSIYKQIILKRGVLRSDQELTLDPMTNATVNSLSTDDRFPVKFGLAMVRLGGVGVLTGKKGEIRKVCFAPNPKPNDNQVKSILFPGFP